jgi:hypothetical protein
MREHQTIRHAISKHKIDDKPSKLHHATSKRKAQIHVHGPHEKRAASSKQAASGILHACRGTPRPTDSRLLACVLEAMCMCVRACMRACGHVLEHVCDMLQHLLCGRSTATSDVAHAPTPVMWSLRCWSGHMRGVGAYVSGTGVEACLSLSGHVFQHVSHENAGRCCGTQTARVLRAT